MKKFYSVKEAAGILGFSTNTVYKYLDDGKLKGRRLGRGRFKIPYDELAPYIAPIEKVVTEVRKEAVAVAEEIHVEVKTEVTHDGNLIFNLFLALVVTGLGVVYLSPFMIPAGLLLIAITLFPERFSTLINFPQKAEAIGHTVRVLSTLAIGYTSYLVILQKDFIALTILSAVAIALFPKPKTTLLKDFLILTLAILGLGGITSLAFLPMAKANPIIFIFILFGIALLPLSLVFGDSKKHVKTTQFFLSILSLSLFGGSVYLLVQSMYPAAFFGFFYAVLSIFVLWYTSREDNLKMPSLVPLVFGWMGFVILLGLFVVNVIQQNLKASARAGMQDALELKAGEIDRYFDNIQGTISSNFTQSDTEPADSYETAKGIYNTLAGVSKVGVVDNSGTTVAVYPRNQKMVGENVGSAYFDRSKDSMRGFVTPLTSSAFGGKGVYATEPTFTTGNDVDKIIFVGVDLEDLSVKYQASMEGARFYAVDENGNYVLHQDTSMIGQKVEDPNGTLVQVETEARSPRWKLFMELPKGEVIRNVSVVAIMVSVLIIVNSAFCMGVFLFTPKRFI